MCIFLKMLIKDLKKNEHSENNCLITFFKIIMFVYIPVLKL